MSTHTIVLPSKPRIVKEDEYSGVYEIDGLYPGYGHTLGNSLRRIILSSLPGAAITTVKIDGVGHEFSVMDGVKEDVINIILNLKKVSVKLSTDETQTLKLKATGPGEVKAGDIDVPGQVEILNPDLVIATITDKNTTLDIEMTAERGLGYLAKEFVRKDKVDIGVIALDAIFTPIRRVNYEVEDMRVGDRTDFNRLKISIETDGTITPKEALENGVEISIAQLKAIVGFKEEEAEAEPEAIKEEESDTEEEGEEEPKKENDAELLKTRVESLDFSAHTQNALAEAGIRTIGGLVRKKEEDILDIDGLGAKGLEEIKKELKKNGVSLKQE